MNLAVLLGSYREARAGIRVANFVIKEFENQGWNTKLLDAKDRGFKLLDKMYKEYSPDTAPEHLKETAKDLIWADAFVVITAEYNHGLTPGLKNMMDHFQSEFFDKPAGIVSYSAGGFGGVRAAVQFRSVLGELGMVSIPRIYSISRVQKSLDKNGMPIEAKLSERMTPFIKELEWYSDALKNARVNNPR